MLRSHWVVIGAIACVLATSGCPAVKKVTGPTQVNSEEEFGSTIVADKALSTGIKGKVLMPGNLISPDGTRINDNDNASAVGENKPVKGAKVYSTDQRLKSVPEFGTATSSASGDFAFRPIAANNVWLIKADFGGVSAATFAVPLLKKEVAVNITLASTVATAGILPLFTTLKPKAYLVRDLDMKKYAALVDAVDKFNQKGLVPVKPLRTLAELVTPFGKMTSNPQGTAVKKAYDDIVNDLKAKSKLREAGKASQIKPPQDTVEDAGTDTGTGTGTDSGTETETPTLDLNPIVGTLEDVPGVTLNSLFSVQMLSAPDGSLAIPDGNRVLSVSDTFEVTVQDKTEEGKSFSDARSVVMMGTSAYTVAKVDGKYNLLGSAFTLGSDGKAQKEALPSLPLTGQAVGAIASIVALNGSTLLAADELNHTLLKIDVTTGVVTLFAGTPGQPGNTTEKSAAASFKFNIPTGMAKDGTDVFVSDRVNNRIVKVTGDQIGPVIGTGALDLKSGALLEARTQQPQALAFGGVGGKLLIVMPSKNAIMVADDEKVVALATEATKAANGVNMVTGPMGAVHHGTSIYIAAKDKLKKFTSP